MSEKLLVTFHLTTGENVESIYSPENFENLKRQLNKDWNGCCVVSDKFGLNFSHVISYKIEPN